MKHNTECQYLRPIIQKIQLMDKTFDLFEMFCECSNWTALESIKNEL